MVTSVMNRAWLLHGPVVPVISTGRVIVGIEVAVDERDMGVWEGWAAIWVRSASTVKAAGVKAASGDWVAGRVRRLQPDMNTSNPVPNAAMIFFMLASVLDQTCCSLMFLSEQVNGGDV